MLHLSASRQIQLTTLSLTLPLSLSLSLQAFSVRPLRMRRLYAVRSHFHSLPAYEEADGDSGGCYALSRYPAQPHDTFPSVFSVTIALSGHVAAVYVVDALLQHRLQVSGGRLMAWKGGERRDRKKKASRAANTARAARRQRRAAQSGKEGCSDDSTDSDSESAVRATAALHSIDSAELSAGLTFHALSAEPASPRSPLFYLFDPLTSRFLSAKRDGRVTVRVSRKTCNEQWRLLALAELGFHSQQHAAAARTQWLETRTRQRHEQREAEESEAYIGRWPEHLVVGRERLAVWRDEVRGVSRASYSQCGGNDAKRLLTLHFDYTQRQAPADDKGGDSAVSRFSANGMSMRMQPTAVQWRATHPVKQRGSGLEEQAEGVTGRAGKQTAVSSAPAASWDPLADVKLEGRALQLTWRQDIAHTLERVSEYDEQLDQQQQQQRHDGRRLTDAASPSRTSHSDTAQPSSPSSPLTRPSTPLVSPSSPLACPSLSPLPPLLSADSSICSPPSVSPATCKTALLLRSRSGVARPSLLSQSSVRGSITLQQYGLIG